MQFIFTTDGHLSTKKPVARKEESNELYIEHQFYKRTQLFEYAKSHNIDTIVDGGDFFQYWRQDNSSSLIIQLIALYKKYTARYLVNIGNHDLPNHQIENMNDSLLGLIQNIGLVEIGDKYIFDNVLMTFFYYVQ